MPAKTDLSRLNCSLAGALSLVGDWWSLLIVRDAVLGVRRFGEFQQSLGVAKNILADRLARLTAAGVLAREGPERRPTYRLTEKGRALTPAVVALTQWGDEWVSDGAPPVLVTDSGGRQIAPVRLEGPDGPLRPEDIRFRPGPGAAPGTRDFLALMASRARD